MEEKSTRKKLFVVVIAIILVVIIAIYALINHKTGENVNTIRTYEENITSQTAENVITENNNVQNNQIKEPVDRPDEKPDTSISTPSAEQKDEVIGSEQTK